MSNNETLFENLEKLLMKVYKYSTILGHWGKHILIIIRLGYDKSDGYSGEGYVVKPDKTYEYPEVCNSCREDVYVSRYDPTDNTDNSYNIYINENIGTIKKNSKKIEELIRDIEICSINAYNIVRNLYLDPSKGYPKLSIHFRRKDISDEKKILEEIKRSIIFGQSISDGGSKYRERPVFRFMALKGSRTNIYNGGINLKFPNYYRFKFVIYG